MSASMAWSSARERSATVAGVAVFVAVAEDAAGEEGEEEEEGAVATPAEVLFSSAVSILGKGATTKEEDNDDDKEGREGMPMTWILFSTKLRSPATAINMCSVRYPSACIILPSSDPAPTHPCASICRNMVTMDAPMVSRAPRCTLHSVSLLLLRRRRLLLVLVLVLLVLLLLLL